MYVWDLNMSVKQKKKKVGAIDKNRMIIYFSV